MVNVYPIHYMQTKKILHMLKIGQEVLINQSIYGTNYETIAKQVREHLSNQRQAFNFTTTDEPNGRTYKILLLSKKKMIKG